MRPGRAKLTLCSAALFVFVAPSSGAQQAPAQRQSYSLVVAQAVDSAQSTIPLPCPEATVCVDNLSFGSFIQGRTLAGPEVGEKFGAAIATHLRLRDQPMMMIVENREDGSKYVRAFIRASQSGGRACMSRLEFEPLDFHPTGADIAVDDNQICAATPPVVSSTRTIAVPASAIGSADLRKPEDGARFTLEPEGSSGPVILALIETERGYPNGDWYCEPDPDPESICLGASIVIHPGAVVREYGGSANVDPGWRAAKFKQIGAHAVRWVEGGRWLAVIEQTDADYYYIQWKTDAGNGRFCLPQMLIDHYRLQARPDFKLNEAGDRCYPVSLSDRR